MNKLFVALLGASLVAFAAADCPNACSGHGDCQTNWDFCVCYNGFLGADCSQRLCQFGLSWIDIPQGDLDHDNLLDSGFGDSSLSGANRPAGTDGALNPMWRFEGWWERHPAALYGMNDQGANLPMYVRAQEGHFYAECSNRGVCNRDTGLCDCLTGYEGAACNRTVCQNDCSGHGTCETVREVTPDHLHYRLWDADKTRMCHCDGGYFGMDCSQRSCMKNDDPLTIATSREDYSDGLTERGEVQIVEVRCPFNGEMLDPSMSLTYTDAQFGDEYETVRFDPTATGDVSVVEAALRNLPNQVLADYEVDGATLVRKVESVTAAVLEQDNYYQWTISFGEHLGDVPMLKGTPYFKCKGGAEVNTMDPATGTYTEENIDVTFLGDGPDMFLEIDGPVADNAGTDEWAYTVFNSAGAELPNGPGLYVLSDTAATAFTDTAITRELNKVALTFGEGASFGSRVHLNIKIHVDPVVIVRNSQYQLDSSPSASRAIESPDVNEDFQLTVVPAASPGYDQHHQLLITTATLDTSAVARYYVNGEFLCFVSISTGSTVPFLATAILDGGDNAFDATFHTLPTLGHAFIDTIDAVDVTEINGADDGSVFNFYLEKDPVAFLAVPDNAEGNDIDDITVRYSNQQAPSLAISLVIQITETHTSPDKYRWKVAGDDTWVEPTGAAGYSIQGSSSRVGEVEQGYALGDVSNYVSVKYPDDPMRQGVASILLDFADGADHDERLCTTQSTSDKSKYYIQIGTMGLNDSPECSDRGICDYGSGLCRCYKGYAGIDCSEQNALSAGYSGGSSTTF